MSDDVVEEITQGDTTPKVKFWVSVKNFLYAITFAVNLKVMVLRLIIYCAIFTGIVLAIVKSAITGSALVFFEDFVMYILAGVGLFALTEIINRNRK